MLKTFSATWEQCFNGGFQISHVYGLQKRQNQSHSDGHHVVALLKECTALKDLDRGKILHREIAKTRLLKTDAFVGNTLIDMYAKCGFIAEAKEVFEEMEIKDVVSWNALIGGYANHQFGELGLTCFERMQLEGLFPDAVTYVCVLKACASLIGSKHGQKVHVIVQEKGVLKESIFVGNALMDMYAKHGLLSEAQKVLEELPVRDVVSWNTLIAAHMRQNANSNALCCFRKMTSDGVCPNAVTYYWMLKACAATGSADKGLEIYRQISWEQVLEIFPAVGEWLMNMFINCDLITNAYYIFSILPNRNVVSWAMIIGGCIEYGTPEQALEYAEQMRVEGFLGNSATFVCRLQSCGMIAAIDKGIQVHIECMEIGAIENNTVVGNALVDMYAKCGMLAKAYKAIRNHFVQNVVSWTSLMTGYINHELNHEALNCFDQMQQNGISPNNVSFILGLKACCSVRAIDKGLVIHAELARNGLGNEKPEVGNAVLNMYVKFGYFAEAHEVFEELPVRDAISWTTIIGGLSSQGFSEKALAAFERMRIEGISPTTIATVCGLQACESLGAIDDGRRIHALIVEEGFLEKHIAVRNALISMYAKFGLFGQAWSVLNEASLRDVVTWTVLIAGYVFHERSEEAFACFELMWLEMILPSSITLICVLKACSNIGAVDKGFQIHAQILKIGMIGTEPAVWNALIDMYCKFSFLQKAQFVFDHLVVRDIVSWNTLISGYVDHNLPKEALSYFEKMELSGLIPDAVSFVCILKACGILGAIQKGSEIHAEIGRKKILERGGIVGNALVEMYAKFGFVAKAQEVFDRLLVHDSFSWTSLITAHAHAGLIELVFSVFSRMRKDGIEPDVSTFTNILQTCSQAGLVGKGQLLFEAMSRDFGLIATREHHTCMVSLLGQAGHFDEAIAHAKGMPSKLDPGVWNTLLNICQKWGNIKNGLKAFVKALQLDRHNGISHCQICGTSVEACAEEAATKGVTALVSGTEVPVKESLIGEKLIVQEVQQLLYLHHFIPHPVL